MAARKSGSSKKYFTPAQANAMLPLVRRIVQDITELAGALRERQERIAVLAQPAEQEADETGREEVNRVEEVLQLEEEFERGRERMTGYVEELRKLGVELKDFFVGLIDFPCWMEGREVCLCWRQGEPEVGHWHEVDAGFAGRQPGVPKTPPRALFPKKDVSGQQE